MSQEAAARPAIPRTVWMLGFVSLLMDTSSELIHGLLPVFLVSTMGMSLAAFGLLEGVAEATALFVKMFAGAISDWLGRRKMLILLGYGLAAVTKPMFPLAGGIGTVVAARLIDRVGKGIRGAPRDALIADVAPPEIRGACFGLRQSMDTVGAFLGPLAAVALMFAFADDIRSVLWFAVLPAFAAVALVALGVEEAGDDRAGGPRRFRSPLNLHALGRFPRRYWLVLAIGAFFSLARFSEGFLVLRAEQAGLPLAWLPGVMVIMSLVYSLAAYPVGVLADRIGHGRLLAAGLALLVAADLVLGLGNSIAAVLAGVALWGLHMGFTQGLLAALVADHAPEALRGTAFGLFNLAAGMCLIAASALAGWLWQDFGPAATFLAGAALAAVPLVAGLALPRARQGG